MGLLDVLPSWQQMLAMPVAAGSQMLLADLPPPPPRAKRRREGEPRFVPDPDPTPNPHPPLPVPSAPAPVAAPAAEDPYTRFLRAQGPAPQFPQQPQTGAGNVTAQPRESARTMQDDGSGLFSGNVPNWAHAIGAVGTALGQVYKDQPVNLDKNEALMERAKMAEALRDPQLTAGLTLHQRLMLQRLPPEAAMQWLMQRGQGADPQSGIAKLAADYRAGLIDRETFIAARDKMLRVGSGGFSMTLPDGTQVSLGGGGGGKAPAGYGYTVGPDGQPSGMAAIPGGPAWQKQQEVEQAQQRAAESTERYGNIVLEDIGRARDLVKSSPVWAPTTGLGGQLLSNLGGTAAHDLQQLTDSIRANVGFDRLQQMRDASPTGGALGQVTERELAFLQRALGSLEQSQSEDQLMSNLDRLERVYSDVMRKAAAYPNASEFGFEGMEAAAPEAEETREIDGKTYRKINGEWYEF